MKQKAKRDLKRSFKTYRESRKRVKEIQKARQPYYPVVALGQPSEGARPTTSSKGATVGARKQDFRYDKSKSPRYAQAPRKKTGENKPRQEDAHTTAEISPSFAYMVNELPWSPDQPSMDALLASIIRFQTLFVRQGLPPLVECALPAGVARIQW